MSSFFSNFFENTSLVDVNQFYWYNSLTLYLNNCFSLLKDFHNKALLAFVEITPKNIHFDSFQWVLFKLFGFILILNLILIVVVWRIYGKSIGDRFMRLCKYTKKCQLYIKVNLFDSYIEGNRGVKSQCFQIKIT